MRTEGGSPNVINGVSRQPVEVRLPSQLQESVNQFPTVTRGLVPRNPAVLMGRINSPQPENATTHLIDRDEAEQYNVTISPNGVEVTDLAGNPKVVNAPNGWGYLAGAQKDDLEALTVADGTFILNKRKVVAHDPTLSPAYMNGGLVHIVQGDYHTSYKISVNGTQVALYTTDGGPYADEGSARSAERGARPAVIANMLVNGTDPEGLNTLPTGPAQKLSTSLSGYAVARYDNVIYIQSNSATTFTLTVDAGSETKARAHKDTTTVFSELPRKCPHGFAIQISGSEDSNYDDYYVRFDHPTGAANGRWKETIGPSIPYMLDASTMPHMLVREADGTFTFKQATYDPREVGDLETNPWPSFVGRTIDGLVFYKNRVGFISGESTSLSRHGSFFNFFIESILTPLDTDPIDVAISYPEVSDIQYAVPYAGEIVMFTKSVPFRLSGGDTFTPKTANFDHLMSNATSGKVRPVTAGVRLFFVNDVPSGCFVHEFTYDRENGVKTAPSITDHVNGYIPPGVTMMAAEEDLSCLVLVSENEPNSIYLYKWLWIGQQKAQSAWQKWTLPAPVVGMKFFGEELVVVTAHTSSREVYAINCHEDWRDEGSTIYLDRRAEVTGTYNATTNVTTWVAPYPADGALVVLKGDSFGYQPGHLEYSGNTITAPGWHSGPAFVGFEFESYGELSPLVHRTSDNQGSYGNAVPGVTTTIANVTFETDASVYLNVDIERSYRKPHGYRFSAALVGTKTSRLGALVAGKIKKTCSVLAKSEDATIRFGNRGPYAYCVMSYRWTGDATATHY